MWVEPKKKQLTLIKLKIVSKIGSKKVARETADVDDEACSGISDAAMVGVFVKITAAAEMQDLRRRHIRRHICRRRRICRCRHKRKRRHRCRYRPRPRRRCICRRRLKMSVKRAGLHVMWPWSRSLGVSLVPADWQVRVFSLFCTVDRLSYLLYVHTIPLSRCMWRRFH